jgi:hypothetical protein
MTQSQLPTDTFYSVTSIAGWAGMKNNVLYLFGDESLPYVEKDDVYYYFGRLFGTHEYSLITWSTRDIGEN